MSFPGMELVNFSSSLFTRLGVLMRTCAFFVIISNIIIFELVLVNDLLKIFTPYPLEKDRAN